jgi:uncharacterized RDD family membrane protein YckC
MTTASSAPVSAADFGSRFSAFVVDALLLFSAQWIIFIVLSRQLQAVGFTSTEPCAAMGATMCEGPSTALWALLLLVFVATSTGYHAVFEGRYGATPGKRWMGLTVTDNNGAGPVGLTVALLRSVVRQLFWLSPLFLFEASPLFLGLPTAPFVLVPLLALGVFVLGAFRSDGLAGHDLAARTMVVRTDRMAVRQPPAETSETTSLSTPAYVPPFSPLATTSSLLKTQKNPHD